MRKKSNSSYFSCVIFPNPSVGMGLPLNQSAIQIVAIERKPNGTPIYRYDREALKKLLTDARIRDLKVRERYTFVCRMTQLLVHTGERDIDRRQVSTG